MTPIKLATIGIIAAGAMFGALTASAAPISSPGTLAQTGHSTVIPAGYYCWWSYGHRYCGYRHYHRRYYRHYYRY